MRAKALSTTIPQYIWKGPFVKSRDDDQKVILQIIGCYSSETMSIVALLRIARASLVSFVVANE